MKLFDDFLNVRTGFKVLKDRSNQVRDGSQNVVSGQSMPDWWWEELFSPAMSNRMADFGGNPSANQVRRKKRGDKRLLLRSAVPFLEIIVVCGSR
jgi:hypothetical protein